MSQVITNIDGINVKLSNLDKVLWPEDGITKAEIIQYYLSVFNDISPLINDRPLTLIRYPDGIHGNKFYSKNAPDFTPEWVSCCLIDDINYVCVQKSADLVYLANLASLELHAMTIRCPKTLYPDTMIFDLDPSVGVSFELVKEICIELSGQLIDLGYHAHIKTSGSKGLHIYVPIIPQYTKDQVFDTAKEIGQKFIEKNKMTTLRINKEKRQGKILIDIYRNHQGQTCVAPLSTRAKKNAPVSMPLNIDDLSWVMSADQFNIHNALEYLNKQKPWNNYSQLQTILHGQKNIPHYDISQSSLEEYNLKRDFSKTSEPKFNRPVTSEMTSKRYVIQKHDAQNLHYDLRLEENGALVSWAIPKCLPTKPGIKRLAVRTEDHPLEYLTFEGVIPKGEYGGGTMWVFDHGSYHVIKKDNTSYRIILSGGAITGEYVIYHTQDNKWIIERSSAEKEMVRNLSPMLAEQSLKIPDAHDFFFELKWDGIRATVIKQGQSAKILSRTGKDITSQFPEITEKLLALDAEETILDGELISPDEKGAPIFANIISRMHTKHPSFIASMVHSCPVVLYLFDLLYLDGIDCQNLPIERRREWMEVIVQKSDKIRISESMEDGKALFEAAKSLGLEGIMAKKKQSKYTAGKRSSDWLKIKIRALMDTVIIGYTKGKGDRIERFGAMHIGKYENGKLVYLGKVGTGFDTSKMKELDTLLKTQKIISKPIQEFVEEEYNTVWIEPALECEVQYASITPNGTLREPVFYRLKEYEG
ncbi:MAG: non-homologous end-joining DNA ligase [Saprospiraceae bacterium]|nr:non-homologous end-joining DNA ligase [Saprospiraceae bacterium]